MLPGCAIRPIGAPSALGFGARFRTGHTWPVRTCSTASMWTLLLPDDRWSIVAPLLPLEPPKPKGE
jgi:hypothetical protein